MSFCFVLTSYLFFLIFYFQLLFILFDDVVLELFPELKSEVWISMYVYLFCYNDVVIIIYLFFNYCTHLLYFIFFYFRKLFNSKWNIFHGKNCNDDNVDHSRHVIMVIIFCDELWCLYDILRCTYIWCRWNMPCVLEIKNLF